MSKIRLHGSSSGYTEIAPVAASGNNTITLPNDGTIISKDSAGAIGVTSITVGTGVTIGDGRLTATSGIVGLTSTGMPSGSIIQVKQTVKTDGFSINDTASNTDVTGLSVTITPTSASNKILIDLHMSAFSVESSSYYGARFQLVRDSTDIAKGDADGSRERCTGPIDGGGSANYADVVSAKFLDSPNTTSATTYKVQIGNSQSKNTYVNRPVNTSNSSTYSQCHISSITVMEVAA
tara:strand:- start:319 stop:1026 length:708 start_codon:yes stop_codon:yes gene_type:complete